MIQGYEDLREGVAWIDLTQRGKLKITGEDRVRLLHAMTTNNVAALADGQGLYAFFLTAQGRIIADVNLFRLPDFLLLDLEPEQTAKIHEHLDKYIIADDVTVEDITADLVTVGLEGPRAEEVLKTLGAPVPAAPWAIASWGNRWVATVSATGGPGFSIFLPATERPELLQQLEQAGVRQASVEAVRTVRLENGKPRYGEDITERHLAQETRQMHAVSFQKGCYLGQEIVERVRSRALLHRSFAHFTLNTAEVPPPGTEIHSDGQKVGEITSAAYSPALGKVVALGYLRLDFFKPNAPLTAPGDIAVQVRELPAGG
jgi:folate-binding protein YgfZ